MHQLFISELIKLIARQSTERVVVGGRGSQKLHNALTDISVGLCFYLGLIFSNTLLTKSLHDCIRHWTVLVVVDDDDIFEL